MTPTATQEPTSTADRLRKLRRSLKLGQVELAARLGVAVGTWRNWEQGRSVPTRTTLALLRLAFPDFFADD